MIKIKIKSNEREERREKREEREGGEEGTCMIDVVLDWNIIIHVVVVHCKIVLKYVIW